MTLTTDQIRRIEVALHDTKVQLARELSLQARHPELADQSHIEFLQDHIITLSINARNS
jgi:hypothetical protein